MKVKKMVIFLAVIAGLMAIGCAAGPKPVTIKAVDIFANESDGLLFVQNETDVDMVLLAGSVTRNIVLGGIRAKSSRGFDISKIENIPDEGVFIIRGVSQNIYQQKNGFITGDDVLYSGLVVYNLKNTEKIQKNIPDLIDSTTSTCIYVSNDSQAACELRLDSPNGTAIAALMPLERNKIIWIKPSPYGYTVYPNFVGYVNSVITNSSRTDGYRFLPTGQGGRIMMINFDTYDRDLRIDLLFE